MRTLDEALECFLRRAARLLTLRQLQDQEVQSEIERRTIRVISRNRLILVQELKFSGIRES